MSLANDKYVIPGEQKIKHLMPVPQEMTVMLECEDESRRMLWRDYRGTPFGICFAAVEEIYNGERREAVRPYNLTTGEVLNDNSMVIQLQRCPKCGKLMKPQIMFCEPSEVSFSCECGYHLDCWDNDWSEECDENELSKSQLH